MSRIRGRNTSPELLLRQALTRAGLRYRIHYATPAGRVDVAFPREKLAIEVDGCFWHGCPEHYVRPRGRASFWAEKLTANVERDRAQTLALLAAGWRVLRYWEHEVATDVRTVAADILFRLRHRAAMRRRLWRVNRVEPLDPAGNRERRWLTDLFNRERSRVIECRRSTAKW